MSRVAKGQRNEKKCADELKAQGYLVWKTIRHRFLNIDLFGLFDVAALAADGSHLILIQVKSNKVEKSVLDKIAALPVPPGVKKQVWVWKDRQGWEKHDLSDNRTCLFCRRAIAGNQATKFGTEGDRDVWACVACDTWAREYIKLSIINQILTDLAGGEPEKYDLPPITEKKKETIN